MVRSLSPLLRQELANLDKDADSRRSAMKALKSYAKDLDSKAIPHFLAEVSDTKGPGSSSGECTISLYEVLARVHGRNIVPQIDNIMSTIMRTLSSSGGSFPLHQACSKVVPAIARYGIDPSTPNNEKMRIISSLCKPLSDALMGRQESAASGAALCLKALVESNNWRFASDDMVNDVCLKVAGALEEKATQTNAHMGLVMALVKHNGLVAEAYARSLVRSGLQILSLGAAESYNSQKRLSAIQMVNFLMKCVDPRSISSELAKVVDVMEQCQHDRMPFVRGAAFEALQTAKMISGQKGSRHEIVSSPSTDRNFHKKGDRSPYGARDGGSHSEFASPESQTIDSYIKYEMFTDSPVSAEQSSRNFECGRRAHRRLWNNDGGGVDISLKDGFFIKACSESNVARAELELSGKGSPSDTNKEQSEAFSGFMQCSATSTVTRDTTPSPQRSRPQLTIDDVKIYTTPRKLMRSLQNSTNDSPGGPEQQHNQILASPCSGKVELNATVALNVDSHNHNFKSDVTEKKNNEKMILLGKHSLTPNDLVPDGAESVSSTGDVTENSACKVCREGYEDNFKVLVRSKKRLTYGVAVMGFTWGLLLILVAVILSAPRTGKDELFFDVVPT